MLEPIFQSFEKLFTEFSWKRLFYIAILVTIAVGLFFAYERYTHYFQLARIERTTNILTQLYTLSADGKLEEHPELKRIHEQLTAELELSLSNPEINLPISRPLLKFLAGAFLWVLISFIYLPDINKGDKGSKNAFIGLLISAVIFGGIGILIPNYPLVNYVVYPVGHFVFFVALILIWGYKKRVRAKSSAA